MTDAAPKLPHRMTERELVVRFLKRRADFWDRFPCHEAAARILRSEAHIIEVGRHTMMRPTMNPLDQMTATDVVAELEPPSRPPKSRAGSA